MHEPTSVEVEGASYKVVEHVKTHGKDVPEGTYPVVLVDGKKRVVVDGELRVFSPRGDTIRAKRGHAEEPKAPAAKGHDAPEVRAPAASATGNTVQVSPRTAAVLRAISTITGDDPGAVIDQALEAIAAANDIPPALLTRILARVGGALPARPHPMTEDDEG